MKMRLTAELGLLPTDPRVMQMTELQWMAYAKVVDNMHQRKARSNLSLYSFLLGTSTKEGKVVPLSFMYSDAMQKEFAPLPMDVPEVEEEVLTDEMADHLEEVMGADIDAMITDEDRKRLLGVKLEELLKEEELAGIIVKERS